MPKNPVNRTSAPKDPPKGVTQTATHAGGPPSRVSVPTFTHVTKPTAGPGAAGPGPSRPVNVTRPQTGAEHPAGTPPANVSRPPGASGPATGKPVGSGSQPGMGGRPGAATPGTGHATGTATAPAKSPTVLTSVPVGHPQLTPRVNNIHFLDPNFALNIANLRPGVGGVPRDQVKVPISPSANVTDDVLFEDPAQPTKKLYLPRYQLEKQNQRYGVAFRQDGTGWSFVVHLTKFTPPSIAAKAGGAQEIDHHAAVLVRFNQMIGNQPAGQEELSFQEVSLKGGVLQASLHLDTLQQRDLLYQALTDRSFATTLIVRRAITVGVPVPEIPIRPMLGMAVPPQGVRAVLGMVAPPPGMRPSPAPAPTPAPPQTKPAVPSYRQANCVLDQAVEPKPFEFSPELHKYIFSGIVPGSGENLQLTRYQVPWGDGRSHTYYQDAARPGLFYYLPDSFKIARRADGVHEPLMSVSFGQATSAEDLKATFSFVAVPYVDPKRLLDAADKLKASAGEDLPKGVGGLQFEPLLSAPGKTHFSLSYPGCDTSKGPFEPRDKAMVDLRSGVHDSFTMSLTQFQSLYDALFSSASLLLTGKVDVELGSDSGEEIPFSARMDDLCGDFLGYTEQSADGSSPTTDDGGSDALKESVSTAIGDAVGGNVKGAVGDIVGGLAETFLFGKKDKGSKKKKDKTGGPSEQGVQATVQNIIESPVEIQSLGATLVRGRERLPAVINGLDLSQPIEIKPGEHITFTVAPSEPVSATGPVHVEYDLAGVHVNPDKDAIWKETLDPTTAESYLTTITVKTPASTFAVPAADPSSQIVSLVVDFDSGVSSELNASRLEAKADLPHQVANFVLRKADPGEYRYKLTVVRANGQQTRDSGWRPPETTTVLFPAVQ
jgi:hypothetical protein